MVTKEALLDIIIVLSKNFGGNEMKRILILLTMTISFAFSGFAQEEVITQLEGQLKTLSEDLAAPATSAATIGLTWSDAHIGNFPHFGVGVFTGAAFIPLDGIKDLLKVLDNTVEIPDAVEQIPLGLPLPALGVDGRIGGFILPFDIGIKYAAFNLDIDKFNIDYSLIGADVRYALIEENLVLPGISVGAGFSRLTSNIKIKDLLGEDITILEPGSGYSGLYLEDPDVEFGWTANVIEFKAQVSKSLIFVTPYAGANFSYGMTQIGGGVKSGVTDKTNTLTQDQIDTIRDKAALAGVNIPKVNADGFTTEHDLTAMGLKINGGLSFNLFLAKIDLNVSYDVMAEIMGTQLGFRIQF